MFRLVILVSSLLMLSTAWSQISDAHLQEELDGSYVILKDYDLRFSFDEEYSVSGELDYNIYNDDYTSINGPLISLSVKKGNNRYFINSVHCEYNIATNAYYILEVRDSKNRVKYLRFFLPYTEAECDTGGGGDS